jgi:hypothetical protein
MLRTIVLVVSLLATPKVNTCCDSPPRLTCPDEPRCSVEKQHAHSHPINARGIRIGPRALMLGR